MTSQDRKGPQRQALSTRTLARRQALVESGLPPIEVRTATRSDWPVIWPIFRAVIAAGDTYCLPTDMTTSQAEAFWFGGDRTTVLIAAWGAVPGDDPDVGTVAGAVLGTAAIHPNHDGNGAHIANGSFMVDPRCAGAGVGRALAVSAIASAREQGYRGMQFNAVVESNAPAVHLWQSLGFEIIGTTPGAFHHPVDGYVGLHVMYRTL